MTSSSYDSNKYPLNKQCKVFTCLKHILDTFFLKNKRKGWGQRMYRQMQYNLKNVLFHYVYIYMTQIFKVVFY